MRKRLLNAQRIREKQVKAAAKCVKSTLLEEIV